MVSCRWRCLLDENGRARGLRLAECEMVDGVPTAKEGTEFEIEADLIVSAIGQSGDLTGIESFDNGKGLMNADAHYRSPIARAISSPATSSARIFW